ncbi:hypothetical protein [Cnuibacter physcomitrellae]|uniref:hypothetical protein n=1 Tax=Cnuibacter physcomitrellae TaxID=1619308 RepID=UPI0012F51369|nr:hypothetical protein [Cnuibacter physcomitrellae]
MRSLVRSDRNPPPFPERPVSRRSLLLGALVGGAAVGAVSLSRGSLPAIGEVPAAGGLFDPDLNGQHPRIILGTRVSLTELQRRAAAPAYAGFVSTMLGYATARAALPTITGAGNDAQWQTVYWGLPELAMSYLITGDSAYATKVRAWTLYVADPANFPDWGGESGGSMSNAVGLIAVAVAYDWCFELFSESERTMIRNKLALQADRLIAQFSNTSVATEAYWKNDPQPNHRHFRIDGVVTAAAAIHGDGADDSRESDDYRLEFGRSQLRQVLSWISPDGSQHESITYATYGNEHLVRAVDVLESVGGGDLWADPEIPGMGSFKVDVSLPRNVGQFAYGDTDGSLYYFNPYLWHIASKYQDGELQEFLQRLYQSGPAGVSSFYYNAWNLLWHDDSLVAAGLDDRPTTRLYPDLGVLASRSTWGDDGVSLHHKAGVMGGVRLNEWRDRLGPNTRYINVGHDHPDGGHYSVSFGGAIFGAYAPYGAYLTKQTNSVVAGADLGQAGERASGFTQPYTDMRGRASIPAVSALGADMVSVADVSGLYAAPSTSGITRCRRTIAFVDRQAAIVLDDVVASSARDIHSLFHSKGTASAVTGGSDIAQTVGSSTVTARYLQSSPDSGATFTSGAGLLPELGTTWRTTVPTATSARIATALVPQRSAADAATLTSAASGSQFSADLTRPNRVDTVAIATSSDGYGALSAAGASGNARALLIRSEGSTPVPTTLTAVDATFVEFVGARVEVVGTRRNLRLTSDGTSLTVQVDAVVPGATPAADLVLGNLAPGPFSVTVDGTLRDYYTVSASGRITVALEPSAPHTLVYTLP